MSEKNLLIQRLCYFIGTNSYRRYYTIEHKFAPLHDNFSSFDILKLPCKREDPVQLYIIFKQESSIGY